MAREAQTPEQIAAFRQQLTEGALQLCLADGPEAVTFRALARRSGISHTLPYRYFRDKAELISATRAAATDQFAAELENTVEASRLAGDSGLQQLRAMAQHYARFAAERSDHYRFITSDLDLMEHADASLMKARERLFRLAETVVARAENDGAIVGDPRTLAHLFWASLHGLMSLHATGQLVHGRNADDLLTPLFERLAGA